ncbi:MULTISPECIES: ABC transporter permease [unclassified Rathayibacter]|uniref:ABC transporter permease n=1 Tax=unclassified Rathayibacter TaxID=2609250 RepID=UPI00188A548B|nr:MULTISPECIES: FtsX-like permease family protein [unclassified Rathayibacter]MBF4462170.1 FtsX-like permease family protein [Rathayibacter sp. VKM Ac-2879]MBF4503787.1 FtsX-like permease family protein [Rathayibacter sp. VKM Ac-2878]
MSGVRTGSRQGGGAVVTVAALSSMFGAVLVQVTAVLQLAVEVSTNPVVSLVAGMLQFTGVAFFAIAVYVGGVVTANTVSTVIAGRTAEIALLRLLGASGSSLRKDVVRTGFTQGIVGAALGLLAGSALVAAGAQLAVQAHLIEPADYPLASPGLLLPFVAVLLSTVVASWAGSRGVLNVAPSQATGSVAEPRYDDLRRRRGRTSVAILLLLLGAALLAVGVVLGHKTPEGVLPGVLGGMVSFTGLILVAPVLLPPLTALVGRVFGRGAVARLAAANAIRNPARSARSVIGLMIGTTLVTTFAVLAAMFDSMVGEAGIERPEVFEQLKGFITFSMAILSVLVSFSIVIAAVGMVNTLSQSVLQRRRELGLLRTLGFTGAQVRWMVLLEAAQMILAAALVGVVLGIGYGWCGAEAVFGSLPGARHGLVPPVIPVSLLLEVLLAAVVITGVSAVIPARRATTVSPIAALAIT